MDWDEVATAAEDRDHCMERDTTRRQPFLWRKALNDDDEARLVCMMMMIIIIIIIIKKGTDLSDA